MSRLEQVAAPLIARMVRGERVVLTSDEQVVLRDWAIAIAILRAELVPGQHSFDRTDARTFRVEGSESLDVGVWIVSVTLTGRGVTGDLATSFVRGESEGVVGSVTVLWLRNIAVIVAQQPYRTDFERVLRGFGSASAPLLSTTRSISVGDRSVADTTLLSALELSGQLSSSFMDGSSIKRGRLTEQVLRVRGDLPMDDIAEAVLAQRIEDALAGPWPTPRGRDEPKPS